MSMSSTSSGIPFSAAAFSVGNVLQRTVGLLSRHFLLFFLAAAVTQIIQLFVIFTPQPIGRPGIGGTATIGGLGLLVALVLTPLMQTVTYHAAFQDMLGRPVRVGDSISIAFRRFLPVLGTLICMGLAIGFGCILLLVPGIILAAMFAVAVPAAVVEQTGPFASLGRSRALTKGHRWQVFGIALLLIVASAAGTAAAAVIRLPLGLVIGGLVGFAIHAVVNAYFSIAGVVMYHDLRVAKEGVDTSRIAAVFD